MKHFSHQHHLVLKAGEPKPDGDIGVCDGCSVQISGPFYSCGDCTYYLHKVCAELPIEINHPVHPQHPLTLFSKPPYQPLSYGCDMCHQDGERFVYNCSICSFDLDPICASSSLRIEDKCHDHPLTVSNNLTLCCHICRTEEKGLSYKCSICPFEVHQGCTVSLRPTIVNQIQHPHPLTLLQSMPPEHKFVKKCDICHDRLYAFQCLYFCSSCMFFAHISCATPEEEPQSPMTGNQISEAVGNDGPSLAYLPVHPKSTDLISWFANNYGDRDAITNLQKSLPEKALALPESAVMATTPPSLTSAPHADPADSGAPATNDPHPTATVQYPTKDRLPRHYCPHYFSQRTSRPALQQLGRPFLRVPPGQQAELGSADGTMTTLTLTTGSELQIPVGARYIGIPGTETAENPRGIMVEVYWEQDDSGALCISGHSPATAIPAHVQVLSQSAFGRQGQTGAPRGLVIDPSQIVAMH